MRKGTRKGTLQEMLTGGEEVLLREAGKEQQEVGEKSVKHSSQKPKEEKF